MQKNLFLTTHFYVKIGLELFNTVSTISSWVMMLINEKIGIMLKFVVYSAEETPFLC